MAAPQNFLAAETAIIARITDQVPGLMKVFSAIDLLQVKDWSQFSPAVNVLFNGMSIAHAADNPLLIRAHQEWAIWLQVRNVSSGRATEAARADAGPLLTQLITALHGWRPLDEGQQLRLVASPAPVAARTADDKFSGGMLFPLVFHLPIPIRG